MNFLRKIGAWLWLNKERMVLAVMVCILIFRVYTVLNPKIENDKPLPTPPEKEPIVDVPVPPGPVRDYETRDWSKIWRRPFFRYEEARTGSRSVGQDAAESAIEIELEQIKAAPDGSFRARLRTPSRTGWYTEGQQFEQFTLISIDNDKGCVVIFSEQETKNLNRCIGAAQ